MNLLKIVGVLVFIVGIAILIALPVMWCWNYVMPDMFGLAEIDFWHALVLSLLSSMLFKSPGSGS